MSDNAQNNAPANVPDTEKKAAEIKKFSYFEPITGIVVALACTIIFLWFSPIITIAFKGDPYVLIPTFNEADIHKLWIPIILWGLVRIGSNVAYLIERIYTKRLAIIALVGNGLTAVLTLIIFVSGHIVNPEHIEVMREMFEHTAPWFGEILANANIVVIVIILFVLILDSFTVIRKRKKRIAIEEKEEAAVTANPAN